MSDARELHQEPLLPFSFAETLLSVALLGVGLVHLSGWLVVFSLLQRGGMGRRRLDRVGRFACRWVTRLAGIRIRSSGLERLPPGKSYVFCANHVSNVDNFVIYQAVPFFFRSFQMAAHFNYPVYGDIIRIFGQLPVAPRDREMNQRSYQQALEMLRNGDCFVMLPEGHRTRDGRLGQFYPGAFRLAIEAQASVVPLALKGLRNVSPPDNWRIRPGSVEVLFGTPIPTEGMTLEAVPVLSARTRSALDALLSSPSAEVPRG